MKDVLDIVAEVTRLLENTPGADVVLDGLRTGTMRPEEAMEKLAVLALQAGHGDALVAASSNMEKAAQEHLGAPVTMTHDNGMEVLNPLMEAAIAERASLDGDVPELRSGPLPEGGYPAVPVLTDTMDPVVLGIQLETAAAEVAQEIKGSLTSHGEVCARILDHVKDGAADMGMEVDHALEVAKRSLPAIPTGVKGYEAGSVPALRKAAQVPTTTLAALTDKQRRQYAYKALSSTQGRVSLSGVIQKGAIDYLRAHGINAVAGEPHPDTAAMTKWVVTLWGAEDLADGFNPTTTAIHSMCSDVMESITGHTEVCIRVSPYHGIADRRFGWTLVAGPKERTT
jgi:hypothetical protein